MGNAFKAARVTNAMVDFLERITGSEKREARGAHDAVRWIKNNGFSPGVGAGFMLAYSCSLVQSLIDAHHPSSDHLKTELPSIKQASIYALNHADVDGAEEILNRMIDHVRETGEYEFLSVTKEILQP